MLFDKSPLKKGVLEVNKKGFGFVSVKDMEDVYISSKDMNGAIQGDTVVIEVSDRDNDGRLETLGKIFTPAEFYSHLSVIFTKSPIKPSK